MQKLSLVVSSLDEARSVVELMWNEWGIRGEIEVIPMDGQVKIDVISEQDMTDLQLASLPGKRG